jgi:hypothetical protein
MTTPIIPPKPRIMGSVVDNINLFLLLGKIPPMLPTSEFLKRIC